MSDRVDELADLINDVSYLGKQVPPGAAHAIARVLDAAGYERRPKHVHSWMTLHGGKQQCHACREVRDTPPATPEQIEASRAFLAAQAEQDELRKQVRG